MVFIVKKREILAMLTNALSLEEVKAIPLVESFLEKIRKAEVDETTRATVEEGMRHMLMETIMHSRMLIEMIKEVVESGREEY